VSLKSIEYFWFPHHICLMETDSDQEAEIVTGQQQLNSVTSLTYGEAIVDNGYIGGRACQGEVLSCTWNREKPVQLLTGIYAQLFTLVHTAQTGERVISWDIVKSHGKRLNSATRASLEKLVGHDTNKQALLTYANKCRRLISQTHYCGDCKYLKDQLATKGVRRIQWSEEGFLDSFQAIKDIPAEAWTQGRPNFLNAIK
jgi:hypothetical protein